MAGHDHGAAGQEGVAFGDAAPQDAAVPDRRAFLRIELFAHRRMDAVGGDQQRAFMAAGRLPVALSMKSARTPPGSRSTRRDDGWSGCSCAQSLGRGIEQDLMQRAAMDGELRPFVAGLDPARFAPDRLAVFGEIRQLFGAHAGRVELIEQAKLDQFAHACGSTLMPTPSGFSAARSRTPWRERRSDAG